MNHWLVLCALVTGSAYAGSLRVVSYNVENLFDTVHDGAKEDWEYLPKSHPGKEKGCQTAAPAYKKACFETDWTEPRLQLKLSQIMRVIESQGGAPDLLGLVEVENEDVVQPLIGEFEKRGWGKFQFFMTHSPDVRGIDNVLIYRTSGALKYRNDREIVLKGKDFDAHPTRNVLEVEFTVAGTERLLVYVNHWPSQASPAKSRNEVAKQLRKEIEATYTEGTHVLLMGDFNVIPADKPNPIFDVMLKASGESQLGDLSDTDTLFWEVQKRNGTEARARAERSEGTYFYPADKDWNLLDRFLINSALTDGEGLELDVEAYEIYAPEFLKHRFTYSKKDKKFPGQVVENVPRRYDHNADLAEAAGFSDHFPIRVSLKY